MGGKKKRGILGEMGKMIVWLEQYWAMAKDGPSTVILSGWADFMLF